MYSYTLVYLNGRSKTSGYFGYFLFRGQQAGSRSDINPFADSSAQKRDPRQMINLRIKEIV